MSKTYLTILLCLLLGGAKNASATIVNLEPGSDICSVLSDNIDETTVELTLSGCAPALALKLIPQLTPHLQKLDISDLNLTPAEIPAFTFVGAELTAIRLPKTLRTVAEAAFAGSSLTTVNFEGPVTEIANHAFANCQKLENITLPQEISRIGRKAFTACSALRCISFPPALKTIGEEAFSLSAIRQADLSGCGKLDSIGNYAFASCPELTNVALPPHIIYIGEGVLMACPELKKVEGSFDTVPNLMLADSPAVESFDFIGSSAIKSIGAYAFYNNASAATITLPSSLSYIGDKAMAYASALRSINATTLSNVPSLGYDVWQGIDQSDVTLTAAPDMANRFRSATQWQHFNITDDSTSSLPSNVESNITLAIDGSNLIINSDRAIKHVTAYDLAGRQYESHNIESLNHIQLQWSHHGAYIIHIKTTDGLTTSHSVITR
ncbi:MAG: leucine-rich repeat protein [Muribaculum sp.]|nr:leucine-rich repeat protein [Muribaculaceae bacterium]MCM1081668.1 leucine-rich repeat protein [Muribaculum sp.]